MGSNRHFCRFWREIRGDRREITREGNTKFNTPQKGLQADEIYFLRCIRWRIYRLIGTACPMWWIRISFIDSAISANPRRCIYSKAARCPASERARKLGAIKLRKRMFGRTLRSEPFTPSSIPHQEDGMAIIMWQSFPKNCPRMYLGKCTAITPNCSANIIFS